MIKIITTTNSIDNATITDYQGLVSANIVIGANFFADFAASITDVFGGQSSSYQSKLDELYDKVIVKIKQKAAYLNADAIVGFKIDFDEISGKGKSMFMVTAIGTAVKFEYNNKITLTEINKEPHSENIATQKETDSIKDQDVTDDNLDDVEQLVICAIKDNRPMDARYLLMSKKGCSLTAACKRIEEVEKKIDQTISQDYIDNMVLGAIMSGDIAEAREILITKHNMDLETANIYIDKIKTDAEI